jgi:hypothetical protein
MSEMTQLDFESIGPYVTELLDEFCALGRNGVAAWRPSENGLELIIAPKFMILQNAHKNERVVVGPRLIEGADFDALQSILDARPIELSVGNLAELPADHRVLRQIESSIRRHSIIETPQRAAALFDIVGFSLLSPVQQVAQLNSLECSISAACRRVKAFGISLEIARSNTGDGFYLWNHDQGLDADLALYYVTILTLCENALELEQNTRGLTPVVRSCIHCGGHFSYYQMGLSAPTDHDYIVGELTITLARMSEAALPGQILLGDFLRPTDDDSEKIINSIEFIAMGAEFFDRLNGVKLGSQQVNEVKTYLTGDRIDAEKFYIDKLKFRDKHDRPVSALNLKANFNRNTGEPIYLGLQHANLTADFTVEHIQVTT